MPASIRGMAWLTLDASSWVNADSAAICNLCFQAISDSIIKIWTFEGNKAGQLIPILPRFGVTRVLMKSIGM